MIFGRRHGKGSSAWEDWAAYFWDSMFPIIVPILVLFFLSMILKDGCFF